MEEIPRLSCQCPRERNREKSAKQTTKRKQKKNTKPAEGSSCRALVKQTIEEPNNKPGSQPLKH